MDFEAGLNSQDRATRHKAINEIQKSSLSSEEKKEYFFRALTDMHDSIRSRSVELLLDLFGADVEVQRVLVKHLDNEPFWAVRYLILSKLRNFDLKEHKKILLKSSFDLKPQVRIITAEILSSFEDQEVWDRLIELWKDKDDRVRNKVIKLLNQSEDPQIKNLIDNFNIKLEEKEKKKREIASMFDG